VSDRYGIPRVVVVGPPEYESVAEGGAGGVRTRKVISDGTTSAILVQAGRSLLYGFYCSNTNAEERYLKLYNKGSTPVVGTDTPIMTILIPGAITGAGCTVDYMHGRDDYWYGLAMALTTGPQDNDAGVVAANEVIVHVNYR
jgi:hypothetical protein